MCEAVEQRGSHLGVAEDRRPFAEGKVCGDDDRGLFVELDGSKNLAISARF
jgi:hypothetical protein